MLIAEWFYFGIGAVLLFWIFKPDFMLKRAFTFTVILLCFANFLKAQSTTDEIITKFFNVYKSQSSGAAIDYLFSTNVAAKGNQPAIDTLKMKLSATEQLVGKLLSYELITSKSAGHNVVLLTFVVNFEHDPLTFRFSLYKPANTWQIQDFQFNNSVYDELEESSKTHSN